MAFFAASVDPPDVTRSFADSLGLDYPVLSDPTKDVAKAYGVIAGAQQVASRWTFYVGPDGKILYIDKSVTPATHGKDIAAKLAELGVSRRKPVRR